MPRRTDTLCGYPLPDPALRLLVYNIRYATGTGPTFHLPIPGAGYLRSSRRVLNGITQFVRAENADVVGLIEVDTGSIRSGMVNQAAYIASELGHYSTYQSKYSVNSLNQRVPVVRKQATHSSPHRGHRRALPLLRHRHQAVIIELELDEVCVFWCTCRSSSATASTSCARCTTSWSARTSGDRRGRLQHVLGNHEIYLFMRAAGSPARTGTDCRRSRRDPRDQNSISSS